MEIINQLRHSVMTFSRFSCKEPKCIVAVLYFDFTRGKRFIGIIIHEICSIDCTLVEKMEGFVVGKF